MKSEEIVQNGLGRTVTALAALTLLAAPAAAQRTDDEWLDDCQRERDDRYVYCDVHVEQLSAGSALRIDAGQNGGIAIVGQNRSDIEVHARIQARARTDSDARDIGESVRLDLSSRELSSDGPDTGRGESWHVSYVVFVPARIDLDLEANNGPVSVSGVDGSIEASTRNGPLSLSELAGDVHARTHNGPLTVSLTGSRWSGQGLDAETHNGPVTLRIPDGYSADLETGTVNGPFQSDIPLTITEFRRRAIQIETTLGQGGPPIRAVTTNGPVTIRNR
jgi:DUF4097 and DUF4098 domain-containing protein YvlB